MSGNPAPIVILTRPTAQSHAYGGELHRLFGDRIRVVHAPLMRIEPTTHTIDLTGVARILFTSGNAIRLFCDISETRDIPVLCVGDKTASVARAAGMAAESASGNASDLVALARAEMKQNDGDILHVRGEHAAGDVTAALNKAGLRARAKVIYRQVACDLPPDAINALKGDKRVILPVFSARTAKILVTQISDIELQGTTAVAISPNVAKALGACGFDDVKTAQDPDAFSVSTAIKDLL